MKPHFGHLYGRPNFLHFLQRFICISPQFGQRNFVASAPGGIGLPQLEHVTKVRVAVFSAMMIILSEWFCNCESALYFICFDTAIC
jgi:hypothetical protein